MTLNTTTQKTAPDSVVGETSVKPSSDCQYGSHGLDQQKIQEPLI